MFGYVSGVNLYSYVNNSPLNWGDPFGASIWDDLKSIRDALIYPANPYPEVDITRDENIPEQYSCIYKIELVNGQVTLTTKLKVKLKNKKREYTIYNEYGNYNIPEARIKKITKRCQDPRGLGENPQWNTVVTPTLKIDESCKLGTGDIPSLIELNAAFRSACAASQISSCLNSCADRKAAMKKICEGEITVKCNCCPGSPPFVCATGTVGTPYELTFCVEKNVKRVEPCVTGQGLPGLLFHEMVHMSGVEDQETTFACQLLCFPSLSANEKAGTAKCK